MIPHVQPILELCRALLASATSLVAAVTELLSSITIAVPTFISSEQLMQTIASVIRTPGIDVDRHLNTYIATLTKRVPTGTLLPSLLGIWQDTRAADEKVSIPQCERYSPLHVYLSIRFLSDSSTCSRGLSGRRIELGSLHWSGRLSSSSWKP